jgi:glutamate N-acetyltransferase/amino-acid N-acetyltransferase
MTASGTRRNRSASSSRALSEDWPSPLSLAWPDGFASGAAPAGLKTAGKLDVGVLVADRAVPAAAVFTTNLIQAAPVLVSKEHLKRGRGVVRAVVVNAGNANACTGRQGLRDAREMCRQVSKSVGCPVEQVLVASTGVIGRRMAMDKIRRGIAAALKGLGRTADHFAAFSQAICTTDRWRKVAASTVRLLDGTVHVVGTTKGAGMIAPNMATTLAFLATDAWLRAADLKQSLQAAIAASYNRAMVDGHMSTNDFAVLLAGGASGCRVSSRADQDQFESALSSVCLDLASQIVRDGEGATKRIEIVVAGARSDWIADGIARTIAMSPLVRTAIFGNDPNWGRIVSAVGYAPGVKDARKLRCRICGVLVYRDGTPTDFDAADLSRAMKAERVTIEVELGEGRGEGFVQTADLTHDYVTVNAEYTT